VKDGFRLNGDSANFGLLSILDSIRGLATVESFSINPCNLVESDSQSIRIKSSVLCDSLLEFSETPGNAERKKRRVSGDFFQDYSVLFQSWGCQNLGEVQSRSCGHSSGLVISRSNVSAKGIRVPVRTKRGSEPKASGNADNQ
jgi:hypothetical protein